MSTKAAQRTPILSDPPVSPEIMTKARGYFDRYGWPKRGSAILVALSGGPDSVCVLHVLLALAKERKWRIAAGHVNYRLRGEESDSDEDFCRALCRERGIEFFRLRPSHAQKGGGFNLQSWARQIRYDFLEKIATREGFVWIAVGHHLGDRAETVAAAVLDAAGTFALSGIPPVRGRIIRPLFDCSPEEIRESLNSGRISYRMDRSNVTKAYQRNRIRQETIPSWAKGNPSIVGGLARLGEQLWRQQSYMQAQVTRVLKRAVIAENAQRITLDASRIAHADVSLDPFMLRELAGRLGLSIAPTSATVERFSRLRETHGSDHVEQGRLSIVRSKGRIAVSVQKRVRRGIDAKSVAVRDSFASKRKWQFKTEVVTEASPDQFDDRRQVFLDLDRVHLPVQLRPVAAGDRYRPLGLGGTKKLFDVLADHNVPVFERRMVPVLTDAAGILWPVGQPIAERVKITKKTRRILRVAVQNL
ncbi:MAG: tRNA lysidine(34) synthetase TilS [candidate division Zixibacteria bacterium]|nr:tRNA lysidine(34) synthetase TilS [candidate division Zixibacteria bacterium]